MKKLYLGGAIWGVKDPFTWRNEIATCLPEGWEAVDPLKLSGGVFKEGDDPKALVETDLTAVEESEAVLIRIDQPSWGSAMELFYAHELCIPTIGLRLDKHPIHLPPGPWLRVHCSVILTDIDQVVNYLATEGWVNAAT